MTKINKITQPILNQRKIIRLFRWEKLSIIIVGVVIFISIFNIIQHQDVFKRRYNYDYLGTLYSNSQYVIGALSKDGIGDDGLYAFAGYYYITGGDISQVNFENPPLGKYLIGLSVLTFHNELVINLIYALILYIVVYLIALNLTKSTSIASITLLILSLQPLVTKTFFLSLLDLPMAVTFLLGIYCYILAIQQRKAKIFFLFSALFFSVSFVTRFFPLLPILIIYLTFAIWRRSKKNAFLFGFLNVIFFTSVYFIAHAAYFIYHPSLLEFLKYQKWIIFWRMGNPVKVGNIINTLLFGRYQSWWDNNLWLQSNDWNMLTPVITILGLFGLYYWRKHYPQNILAFMIIIFLTYTVIGTVGVAKFVLPIYPLLTISAVNLIPNIYKKISQRHG